MTKNFLHNKQPRIILTNDKNKINLFFYLIFLILKSYKKN